uniref:Uncharacterized protein n=1 Tax=Anopheles arabiensis TaxID=7173 RepID=A0A182HGY7_ANOAR
MASSTASSVIASTDSYPIHFRSFTAVGEDDEIPGTESEHSFADESENNIQSRPTALPKLKWDKEQFDVRRPYETKNYERPYRDLPGHLAGFEGLNVPARKCTVPSAFARRTPIEEVFHKRNIKSVCPPERSRTLEHCVEDVIVADNVSSTAASVAEQVDDVEQVAEGRIVSKECCKTFFRARRALLRSELFQEYFNREPAPERAQESDESEDELDDLPDELEQLDGSVDREIPETAVPRRVRSTSIGSYQPPAITHKDDKVCVIEAQEQFLERMRVRYLEKFDRVKQQLEEVERERLKPPEPFDAEKYEAEYPKPDIRNETKAHFRETLRQRVEELNRLQQRTVRKYPTSVKQFAAYKAHIMEDRRRLRDEALLVEDYFRNANTPKELPEAKLEVRRYRLAEFGTHPSDSEDEEDRAASEQKPQNEPLVYHTCLTREEWGHWIAQSTKIEKLKLPKVSVPRIPVLVQKCVESPIRAHIQGRPLDGTMQTKEQSERQKLTEQERLAPQPQKIIHSLEPTAVSRKSKPAMRDLLFDPMVPPEPMDYVPYNATLQPYSDIAEERFRSVKGRRKVKRQLRKSRMRWIEELVDEICRRKRC